MDIDTKCDRCNQYIEARIEGSTIFIEPCENCMEGEYTSGYDDGHEEGRKEVEA